MKARYLNAQMFTSGDGDRLFKVRYSSKPENAVMRFSGDNGESLSLHLIGEKVFEIKCTEEAFRALQKCEPASLVDFDFQPNPSNPQKNIITGLLG